MCKHQSKNTGKTGYDGDFGFFVLDTDLDYRDNPLRFLQKYRFAGEKQEIISETYEIEDWF